jgi:hypothetical protein
VDARQDEVVTFGAMSDPHGDEARKRVSGDALLRRENREGLLDTKLSSRRSGSYV